MTALLAAVAFALACVSLAAPVLAASGDRTIYLYYTHTKQTEKFTFRKGGRYDSKVLANLNYFLRDWRRNEPTKMDPGLFDLVWEVYQEAGATGPIHVVSAFRASETNEMLRSRSSAVAKNSRHTMGMAMDFFIPGIPISRLREIAMRKQVGGVGYYPTSGSPFVHLDTGNVRAWPRMTRAQLQKVFPDGKTLHVPADGKVLSQSGYQYAKAQWVKCHSVPCSGSSAGTIRIAGNSGSDSNDTSHKPNLFDWLFGNEGDDAGEESVSVPASPGIQVASVSPAAIPVPAALPGDRRALADTPDTLPFALARNEPAPLPANRPAWLGIDTIMVASIDPVVDATATIPTAPAPLALAAYAPVIAPEPDAQRAVQMLIERRTGKSPPLPANLNTQGLRLTTASVGGGHGVLSTLVEDTMKLMGDQPAALSNALNNSARLKARQIDLIAPDLEHIIEIFIDPAAMSSARYAVIFDHDTADFSPATQLGNHASQLTRKSDPAFGMKSDQFTSGNILIVASR